MNISLLGLQNIQHSLLFQKEGKESEMLHHGAPPLQISHLENSENCTAVLVRMEGTICLTSSTLVQAYTQKNRQGQAIELACFTALWGSLVGGNRRCYR